MNRFTPPSRNPVSRRSVRAGTVGLAMSLLAALSGTTVHDATAGTSPSPDLKACSNSADNMLSACRYDTKDNYFVKTAKCRNFADPTARHDCVDDRAAAFAEDSALCGDQHEGRLDVCAVLGEAPYDPIIDPANFVDPLSIGKTVAPNPYLILVPGYTRQYRSEDEQITVTVTRSKVVIDGVTCIVVQDISKSGSRVNEVTQDFFAQDIEGNVWYFGELSTAYHAGELPSMDGSFKAGIDDAKPGIVMPAMPMVGMTYREEFALGEAEDLAKVLSVTASESVPAASCSRNCVRTRNFSPLEPDAVENKFYAPGIGELVAYDLADPKNREELISYHY